MNFRFFLSSLIFLLLFTYTLSGQRFEKMQVPVYKNGRLFPLLNTGGLRSPQFSNIDLNGDGVQDLFIFDKNGDVIIPLIKTGSIGSLDYRYAPEYIERFPKLQAWALLVDYNNDGIKDIFTSSSSLPNCCVEVWKGGRDASGDLLYEKVTFAGLPFRDILQFQVGSSYTNIYVSAVDLPAIADVDGDGDTDIISFEPDGSFATFYKNVAVEENLGNDTLKFVKADVCWGKFSENQYNEKLTLSSSAFACANPLVPEGNTGVRHSGSTLTVFDSNGDGLMDLIIGDIDSPRLSKLVNGGTKESAWMKSLELQFPADDTPVDLGYFVSAFYVDVDGDMIRDLVVAPNDLSIGENNNHIWLYKNTGTDTAPVFKLVKKDFLIDQMPFFYGGSHPAFADVNGDGLTDIVIGISSIIKPNNTFENRLILLINIGSDTRPVYNVADEDYLDFSKMTQFIGRLAPAFGDLNHDGKPDLLVGDAFGMIYYFKNKAEKGYPFYYENPVYPYFDIFVGQNAKPVVIDIDGDGLNDLVVGKKNNELNYFKNQGTASNPFFNPNPNTSPNERQLGNLFSGNDYYTQNGAPAFIEIEGGEQMLLLGTEAANIRTYSIPNDKQSGYELKNLKTGDVFEGRKIVPALHDIDNDGYYEMLVGNERGGISFYKTNFKKGTTGISDYHHNEREIIIYPNPVHDRMYVSSDKAPYLIELRDINGNKIQQLYNHSYNVLPDNLPNGIYLLTFLYEQGTATKKVLIQH